MIRPEFDDHIPGVGPIITIIIASLPDTEIIPEAQLVIFRFYGLAISL